MRLIDADKMKIGISEKTRTDLEASRFIDIIDSQTTAFDVNKLIEQIKSMGCDFVKIEYCSEHDCDNCIAERIIGLIKSQMEVENE